MVLVAEHTFFALVVSRRKVDRRQIFEEEERN